MMMISGGPLAYVSESLLLCVSGPILPQFYFFKFFCPVLRLNVLGFKEFKRVDYEAFGLTLSAEMTEKSIK